MNRKLAAFLRGMAFSIYPPPLLFPRRQRRLRSVGEALASDWQKIGDDMRNAMEKLDAETKMALKDNP